MDDTGGKGLLIFLLFLAWGLWLMLQVIAMVPQIWTTGVEVNRRNQEKICRILKTMLEILIRYADCKCHKTAAEPIKNRYDSQPMSVS